MYTECLDFLQHLIGHSKYANIPVKWNRVGYGHRQFNGILWFKHLHMLQSWQGIQLWRETKLDLVQLCKTQMFKIVLYGNMIFDILEQFSFQKYTTCWVFLALRHMLYLCILYLYFLYLRVWHMGILFLISLNNPLFKNIPHAGSF